MSFFSSKFMMSPLFFWGGGGKKIFLGGFLVGAAPFCRQHEDGTSVCVCVGVVYTSAAPSFYALDAPLCQFPQKIRLFSFCLSLFLAALLARKKKKKKFKEDHKIVNFFRFFGVGDQSVR